MTVASARPGGRHPRAAGARRSGRSHRTEAAIAAGLLTALVLFAARAAADGPFRITYAQRGRDAKSYVLEGRVFNDADRDVLDVWVTAEALSASGKVLATGITFVGPLIASRDSASFLVKLPRVGDAEGFRLAVTSFRSTIRAQPQSP